MRLNQKTLLALLCASSSTSSSFVVDGFSVPSKMTRTRTSLNIASVEENVGDVSSSPQSSLTPDMKAYAAGYTTVFEELPFRVYDSKEVNDGVSNALPSDLVGTYYKSGPAMFSAGSIVPPKKSIVQPKQQPVPDGEDADRMVKHPFEGDGGILGVTFNGDGTAVARYRFVRTSALTKERKKGKKLYSGMENTREGGSSVGGGQGNDFPVPMYKHHLQPGLNQNRKNTSNTRAVYWSKKLLTLWEGGLPYKLDALGLSTEGKSQLGGILNEGDPFSGKVVYDSKKERVLSYSNKQGSGASMLTLFEFNAKFRVASQVEHKLPGMAIISDFAATDRYALFVQPPVAANGMQFMMSKEPLKALKVEQGEAVSTVICTHAYVKAERIE
jgi:all-trans-8'-apo-beta-carotenal 15,15'-oxygenase